MKIGSLDISKVMVGSDEVTAIYAGLDLVYSSTPPTPPTPSGYSTQYLTLVPTTASSTFQFSQTGLSYSLDSGSTWTSLAASTNTPSVGVGDKIMFKGTITPTSYGIGMFSSSSEFDAEGNAMSLLYGDNFIGETSLSGKSYAFYQLFYQSSVVSAENLVLPATTLAEGCYYSIFYGCDSLTVAPQLPATTLASHCYEGMLAYCTNLTEAPQLSSTTLANYCYSNMFFGCSSLTTAPQLPATTLASRCYYQMFESCTSLQTAPQLPALTLANYCYQRMFASCTSLTAITCLATDISATNCTTNWVNGVAASGTFTKADEMSGWTTGNSGIPSNWTVQDYNPTPTGSCLDSSALTVVSIDENFDQSTFPLKIYQLNFGAFNSMSCYYNCQFQTGIDLYDANNNYIGQVQFDYDFDSQSGDLTVFDSGGTGIYTDSDAFANVNVCTLFGGAVYIQDVPSVENCLMMDCLEYECYEWDEETGECIDQGPCIQEECVMTETIYPLSVLIENNS